jgi:hypothetical protein
MTAFPKEHATIQDVASKVNALQNEVNALEQRMAEQAAAICSLLWMKHPASATANTNTTATAPESSTKPVHAPVAVTAAELRKRQYRLKMDAWGLDHNLMTQLFKLDSVLGDDEVCVALEL